MHDEDIEPHRQAGQVAVLLQQLSRGAGDAALLAPVDAPGRAAERLACARTYLGNDQHLPGARDDVELAQTAAVVAVQDLATRGAQVGGRQLLRALAA